MKPPLYYAVVEKFYVISYLNVGCPAMTRLNNVDMFHYGFTHECILYTEDEVKVLKELHPEAIFIDRKDIFDYMKSHMGYINSMRLEKQKKFNALLN